MLKHLNRRDKSSQQKRDRSCLRFLSTSKYFITEISVAKIKTNEECQKKLSRKHRSYFHHHIAERSLISSQQLCYKFIRPRLISLIFRNVVGKRVKCWLDIPLTHFMSRLSGFPCLSPVHYTRRGGSQTEFPSLVGKEIYQRCALAPVLVRGLSFLLPAVM